MGKNLGRIAATRVIRVASLTKAGRKETDFDESRRHRSCVEALGVEFSEKAFGLILILLQASYKLRRAS